MKKFLSLLMMALLCATAWAGEVAYKTLTFSSENCDKCSVYTTSWQAHDNDNFYWTLEYFNNNSFNSGWTYVKCGRKDVASVATITTDAVIDKAITKVVVTVDAILDINKVNSATLEVADNADFTNPQTVSVTLATGEVSYAVPTPTENCYYRLTYDCAAHTKNGIIQISKVEYFYENASAVSEPVIAFDKSSPVAWDETVTCTITCDTQDATIMYALNDGEFQPYSAPFTLDETTTVKAKGVLGEVESTIATATITFNPAPATVANITEFNALLENTDFTFTGTVTALGQFTGNNNTHSLYVQDAEKACSSLATQVKLMLSAMSSPQDLPAQGPNSLVLLR